MNAVDLLLDQHRHTEALFEEFMGSEDEGARRRVAGEIIETLWVHHQIEEHVLYPAVVERLPDMKDEVDEDLEEHRALERQLEQMQDSDVTDDRYGALVEVTQELVDHHFEEEEEDLFPVVREQFPDDELRTMGERMDVLSRQLRKTREELVEEARAAGVTGYSDMNKRQLAEAISAAG